MCMFKDYGAPFVKKSNFYGILEFRKHMEIWVFWHKNAVDLAQNTLFYASSTLVGLKTGPVGLSTYFNMYFNRGRFVPAKKWSD